MSPHGCPRAWECQWVWGGASCGPAMNNLLTVDCSEGRHCGSEQRISWVWCAGIVECVNVPPAVQTFPGQKNQRLWLKYICPWDGSVLSVPLYLSCLFLPGACWDAPAVTILNKKTQIQLTNEVFTGNWGLTIFLSLFNQEHLQRWAIITK